MLNAKLQAQLENWKGDTEARIQRLSNSGRNTEVWDNKLNGINNFLANPGSYNDSDVENWIENGFKS